VSDTSSILPGVPNRQKCTTIVEEAEIDDYDDGDGDQDNNGYGAEGRTLVEKKICACVRVTP